MITGASYEVSTLTRDEIKSELIGLVITDIEVLESGKACLFFENKEGRPYVIDCTGDKAVAKRFHTKSEEFEDLQEKVNLLAEKLGIDLDEPIEEYYKNMS